MAAGDGAKKARRILGYASISLGGAAILVGASPLFPVFVEAFLVGGLLIAAGLWLIASPGRSGAPGRAGRQASGPRAAAGRRRAARGSAAARVVIDPLLPVRILRLAKERGGLLTVAEAAMALSVPLDQAEAGLSECVRSGNALADFDMERGHAFYRFPEFATRGEGPGSR